MHHAMYGFANTHNGLCNALTVFVDDSAFQLNAVLKSREAIAALRADNELAKAFDAQEIKKTIDAAAAPSEPHA